MDIPEYREVVEFCQLTDRKCSVFNMVLECTPEVQSTCSRESGTEQAAKLPMAKVLQYPELRVNPFGDRICRVFSSSHDGDCTFEDLLDMMSVFSDAAPKAVKPEHAFRVFVACETYFGSKDLYDILNISKQSSEKEVRKAYHKLSLSCHPDRVDEDKKSEATEKFKVLGKVHSILCDPEKRAIYDEAGVWTEEDDEVEFENQDWMEYWRLLFKKITLDDIKKYEDEYKGSEQELEDLKKAYEKCKGDMDQMFQHILFATLEDEDRIRGRLQELIDNEEIPAYDIFINEPQAKRDRRMRKLRKEAKEAEKEVKKREEKEANGFDNLQKAILARRQQNNESFLDALEKKYSGPKMSGKTTKKSSRGKAKK